MSSPKLIVHIGTPKTGTTSIQQALLEARTKLLTDCGTLFPSTGRGKIAHRHVSVTNAARKGGSDAQAEFQAIMTEFEQSGAHTIFLTDEVLSVKSKVANFFERFTEEGFDVEVVCYLRRWDYFVESLYNQIIRMRKFVGVPPINEFWRDERVLQNMDFSKMLKYWENVATKVIVRDFHKEVAEVGLLKSFQAACGFEALGTLETASRNQSHDMRLLMTLCHIAEGNEVEQLKELAKALGIANAKLLETGVLKQQKYILGTLERGEVLGIMRERSQKLTDDYGIDFNDDRPKEPDEPLFAPSAEYLLAMLGELSVIDVLRFHQLAQKHLVDNLSKQPASNLVDGSVTKVADGESEDGWLSAMDDEVYDGMEQDAKAA